MVNNMLMPKAQLVTMDGLIKKVSLEAAKLNQEMLYDAEDYMAIANIIIFLYSVKKTFGNLKTVQKGMQKLLDNYNEAAEYVDEIGIREAYEKLHDEYGVELMFNDFDVSTFFDNEKQYERLKIRITTKL